MNERFQKRRRTTCPLCSGRNLQIYGKRGKYHLATCLSCGLVSVIERIPEEFYGKYYREQSVEAYVEQDTELRNRCRAILDRILDFGLPGRNVLDIGCGSGTFLEVAGERGFEAVGIEADPSRVEWCRSRGLNVICGFFPDNRLFPDSYDLVWLSHIIEHVDEPNEFLMEVVKVMKPDGLLVVSTPNVRSISNLILRCHHRHIIPPEHLSFYSARPLKTLAGKHNLRLEQIFTRSGNMVLKDIAAYFFKLQFIKRPLPMLPTKSFVSGRGEIARFAYRAVTAASRIVSPVLSVLGGEEVVGFFRKPLAGKKES